MTQEELEKKVEELEQKLKQYEIALSKAQTVIDFLWAKIIEAAR